MIKIQFEDCSSRRVLWVGEIKCRRQSTNFSHIRETMDLLEWETGHVTFDQRDVTSRGLVRQFFGWKAS